MDRQLSTHSMITQRASQKTVTTKSPCSSGFKWEQSSTVAVEDPPLQTEYCSTARSGPKESNNAVTRRLPPNVDPEVFKLLPEEIQKELLSPAYANSLPSPSTSPSAPVAVPDATHIRKNKSPESFTDSKNIEDKAETINELDPAHRVTTVNHQRPPRKSAFPGENVTAEGRLLFRQSSDCEFPGNVDPEVFSELPPEVQRELMSEWKQQKPVLKAPSSRKPGRSPMTKDRKAAGKGSQANSLLKYFKPS